VINIKNQDVLTKFFGTDKTDNTGLFGKDSKKITIEKDEDIKLSPKDRLIHSIYSTIVKDYQYSKDQVELKPVALSGLGKKRKIRFPVDLAIFSSGKKNLTNLYMIVVCDPANKTAAIKTIKEYLTATQAKIGIWNNGSTHLYLAKIISNSGKVEFKEINSIPICGKNIEDIGMLQRRDLRPPSDDGKSLIGIFKDIRNSVSGKITGITRDETIASELMIILFCKIFDEMNTEPEDKVEFRAGFEEEPAIILDRIQDLFDRVKAVYPYIFDKNERIKLDPLSIAYIVGEIQIYEITGANRDAIGDLFQVFIGPTLRGSQGQFFTPRNVIDLMIKSLNPKHTEKVLDPACGSGGFLIGSLSHITESLMDKTDKSESGSQSKELVRNEFARNNLYGIDKDSFLARVAKIYLAIMGNGSHIFCENSLSDVSKWEGAIKNTFVDDRGNLRTFDVILTNPPFGSKIKVEKDIIKNYDLGHKWNRTKDGFSKVISIKQNTPPQVLFVERCLNLLKDGGRLGIVLPESMLCNPSHEYIVNYIRKKTTILAIISMPEDLFQPFTHAKTCVVILRKEKQEEDYDIFMSIVKWCGHDSRGLEIPYDDIPIVAEKYVDWNQNGKITNSSLGFLVKNSDIVSNILVPRYYDPTIEEDLDKLSDSYSVVSLEQLVNDGVLSLKTGTEVGKLAYGTGNIPFIRTSDISNWELKLDPKQGVSEEIYQANTSTKKKIKGKMVLVEDENKILKSNDILFVKDGTYLVGTTAMITKYDSKALYQSHLYRIRVERPDILSPYLLFVLLNTSIVKRQIRTRQFTQDIIDTIGRRILELKLPIPKDESLKQKITEKTMQIIEERARLRVEASRVTKEVLGVEISEKDNVFNINKLRSDF